MHRKKKEKKHEREKSGEIHQSAEFSGNRPVKSVGKRIRLIGLNVLSRWRRGNAFPREKSSRQGRRRSRRWKVLIGKARGGGGGQFFFFLFPNPTVGRIACSYGACTCAFVCTYIYTHMTAAKHVMQSHSGQKSVSGKTEKQQKKKTNGRRKVSAF